MNITSMKVSTRLALGFTLVFLFLAAVTAVSIWNFKTVSAMTDTMVNQDIVKERLMRAWSSYTQLNGARTVTIIESVDPQVYKEVSAAIKSTSEDISVLQKQLDGLNKRPEEAALFKDVSAKRATYTEIRSRMLKEKEISNDSAHLMVKAEFQPAMDAYLAAINALVNLQGKMIAASAKNVDGEFRLAEWSVSGLGLFALLSGITAAVLIARSLKRQLGGEPAATAAIANSIAAGDLAVKIDIGPHDHGSLLFSIRSMRDHLASVVTQIRSGADTMATASSEIAAGNLDLSSRTEQQAGSLEETASAMEQLTSTVKQNADNARQANQLAVSASGIAVEGGAVVAQVIDTMSSINASSRKIVDIISVIDGIAFQTNILALNAAVEAARAGEQGRGFAVVASEVRGLAQRSAAAAKEIKALIGDSVEKVDAGSKLVEQAGATISEVVASVKRVTDIVGEISAASQEQSTGIEEVNRAITQMDEVTQQNAALVEQAAAAAASLQEQAARLSQVVSIFALGNHAEAIAATTSVSSRASINITPRPPALTSKPSSKPSTPKPSIKPKPAAAHAGEPATAGEWEQF
ncbi:MAG TPA: methyl-accepting chemotaxis protein [Herbaspirillum sp.]|nr:methyl-accepting chemotaxis protein [Herbaspirillum sp.]